jgi:hypothetical protein
MDVIVERETALKAGKAVTRTKELRAALTWVALIQNGLTKSAW